MSELEMCVLVCDGYGSMVAVGSFGEGGGLSNFTQNAAIVLKTEQCRAVMLIFQSIHYLLCIYLSLSHKEKNQC